MMFKKKKCDPTFINSADLHYMQGYEAGRADAYDDGYQQGMEEAYIECMRIVSECVWEDSEMLEKMIAERFKGVEP